MKDGGAFFRGLHVGLRFPAVVCPVRNPMKPAAAMHPRALAPRLALVALLAVGACTGHRGTAAGFVVSSPALADGGELPTDYTGDGSASTLPLHWRGAPSGTACYALVMHHTDPEGKERCYWVLYDIPGTASGLPKNAQGIGRLGANSINGQTAYAPPHSKGPGPKTYTVTVYALSKQTGLDSPTPVSREALMGAIKDSIIASADLSFFYTRSRASIARDELELSTNQKQ